MVFAQESELQVGSNANQLRQNQGFVKYPGKYIIPIESNVYDLLSYAGGPTEDAHMDDLRLFRTTADSSKSLMKFNYNDLLWDENLKNFSNAPTLDAGDILLVPGSQRLYFKDYLQIGLSVFSALISLSILILNIAK
jgi:protein involved in polysaccharide export with SLBB domain